MSDRKCPFCQQEMRRTNGTHNKVGVWQCQNSNDPDNVCIASGYLFNDDVLNYITRTRKALEMAITGLDDIIDSGGDGYWTAIKTEEQINKIIKGGDNE